MGRPAREICPICNLPREVFVDSAVFGQRVCANCDAFYQRELAKPTQPTAVTDVLELLALDSPKRGILQQNEGLRHKLAAKFLKHGCKCYRCGSRIKRLRGYVAGKNKLKGIVCSTCFHKHTATLAATAEYSLKRALKKMWLQPYLQDNPYVQEIMK